MKFKICREAKCNKNARANNITATAIVYNVEHLLWGFF